MAPRGRPRRRDARCDDRRSRRRGVLGRDRLRRGVGACARPRRPGAARDDVSTAGQHAESACQTAVGVQGGTVRAVVSHRSDQGRLLDRHRRRDRHGIRVCRQGCTRAAGWARVPRRRGRRLVEGRHLRRPARVSAARGRGGAHQCVQFPDLGDARKARAGHFGGRACHREARDDHRVPRGAARAPHHRVGHSARGRTAVRVRQPRRFVRSPHLPGRRFLHRIGGHSRTAAGASRGDRALRAVHRGDRLAQLQHPRRGFGARHGGIRVVHQGGGARDVRSRPVRSAPPSARHWCRPRGRRMWSRRSIRSCATSSSATRACEGVRMGPLVSLAQRERGAGAPGRIAPRGRSRGRQPG